ncbi:hypothetical protein MCAP1_000536 [Malassezia caprae]|uniref:Auxin efflux carrier n=1 Tax=Malassezia caprae TaxID=1381934 RepID=A0AAF0E3P9_9BASI|nr:hypothetical protein MCAP1_000536 [Malassezia caprae]
MSRSASLSASALQAAVTAAPSWAPVLGLAFVTFSSIFQLILVCSIGYLMAQVGVLDKRMQGKMNKLNVSVFTPALLFSKVAFYLSPERLVELAIVPIGFCVVTFVSAVAAGLANRLLGIPRGQRPFVMAVSITPNSNTLPVALISSLVESVPQLHWIRDGRDVDTPNDMLGRALTYLVMFSTLGTVQRWSIGAKLLSHVHTDLPYEPPAENEGNLSGFRDDVTDTLIDQRHRSILADRGSILSHTPAESSPLRNEVLTDEPDEISVTPTHQSAWHRFVVQPWRAFAAFMTVPLWTALASFAIAMAPPLQRVLVSLTPLVGAIEQMGQCSIPLSILVLGAYFAGDDAPGTGMIRRYSTMEDSQDRAHREATERAEKRTIWRTIIAASCSRMLLTPLLMMPLFAYVSLKGRSTVIDDPVFMTCACLLIGSPPALTLAQITRQRAAPSSHMEMLISGTIFVSYIVLTAPITILLVFLALYLDDLQSRAILAAMVPETVSRLWT